jgi:hypothetical protein
MSSLTVVIGAFFFLQADSFANPPSPTEANRTLDQIQKINQKPACDPWTSKSRLQKCQEKMNRLYRDGVANIDLFMGYGDSGGQPPVATDAIERAYLVQKLYSKCGAEPCGFRADPKNANLLGKSLAGGKKIAVKIHSSALSDRDDLNRKNPKQAEHTKAMNEKFKKALSSSETVFYMGHSRDGGGPDFGPPVLDAKGHTDYAWYRKHKPGLKMIQENMRKGQPELYGSFSCDSLKHFAAPVRKVNPDVIYFGTTRLAYYNYTSKVVNRVLLPDRLTHSEAIDSTLLAIGGVADQKCEFNKAFQNNKQPTEADYE